MAIAAQLYQSGREAERYCVGFDATLRDPESTPLDVVVEDLSTSGFRVITGTELALWTDVSLGLAGIGTHRARVVWRDESSYGCEFLAPLKTSDLAIALSAPSSEPVALPAPRDRDVATSGDVEEYRDQRCGLGPRDRFFVIIAAAITAWALVIGLGWIALRAIGIL